MAIKVLIAACLLVVVVEGNFYPNVPYGGYNFERRYPQISYLRPVPPPLPPRIPSLAALFQPTPLPEPPLLPIPLGYRRSIFEAESIPGSMVELPVPLSYADIPDDIMRSGGFRGFTLSSSNTGNGGVTIVTTNDNGRTQTFISPPPGQNKFYRVPPESGLARLVKVTNKLMRGVSDTIRQAFVVPNLEIPDRQFRPRPLEYFY